MLSALGVVLLYIGSLVEALDLSAAVLASLACIIAVIEYGKGAPWAIYGVTSVLSLILLPVKTPAAFYAIFFGFYPILKEKIERRSRLLQWVIKEAIFNVSLVIMGFAVYFLSTTGDNLLLENPLIIAATVVMAELAFVLYDIALTRLISFYIIKLRNRLKF
jgi:hypothetical protein